MRRSKPALVRSVVCLLGVALALTACTELPPDPGTTERAESVNTADWPTVELNGVGPVEKMINVPEGAASFRVNFVCVSGNFGLSFSGATHSDRRGGCQGTRTYLFPAPESALMQLYISVPADSPFALTGEFTTDVFSPDPLITDACTQLSEYMSVYLNADQGYLQGDVSAEEWRGQIDEAAGIITELQDTATGLIALQLPALVAGMSSPVVVPGYFHEQNSPTEMDAARTIVGDVCSDNGSGLVITAAYGG